MPELPDDLTTRLSAFGGDRPVALPGAAAARRRGDQRTRRTRAALAGGGVAAVVAAVVLGGSVLDGGGQDRVSIPATSPAPAPTPTPTPSPAPTPTPTPVVGAGLLEVLLTPEDAGSVLPGPWSSQPATDTDRDVPTLPCGAGPAPMADGDGRATAGVQLSVEREAGGTFLRQDVEEHTGPTTAAQAYDLVRERVSACPEQSLPDAQGGGTVVTEVVETGPELEDGVRTLLVRVTSTCATCSPGYAWHAVQQSGDVLSALRVEEGEDGDRGVEVVEPFADLVAERLRELG